MSLLLLLGGAGVGGEEAGAPEGDGGAEAPVLPAVAHGGGSGPISRRRRPGLWMTVPASFPSDDETMALILL